MKRNKDFIKTKNSRMIVSFVKKKHGVPSDDKVLLKTSLLRYHKECIKERKKTGAPPSIPLILLNAR